MKKTINHLNIMLVFLQGIFTLITLTIVIISFFQTSMEKFIPFCFGITLFSLAVSNYKIYQRKNMTLLYSLCGIICIIYGIISWSG